MRRRWPITIVLAAATAGLVIASAPAQAYEFTHPLRQGRKGRDVRALQVRVAGWFGRGDKTRFLIDGDFGPRTMRAVRAFQRHYGLKVDGVAGPSTFKVLRRLEDKNGSTKHFDFSEFVQNRSGACSAKANAYAGTFGGGMVAPARAKRYVRRLMWRLEAVRAKGGGKPIGVNSGFRSVAYNDCIGGAGLSQHTYGTAADTRMAGVTNRHERALAKRSQFHGISCYQSSSHNHLDLRLENRNLPEGRHWWWPKRDKAGHDLDESGRPCWGEGKKAMLPSVQPSLTTAEGILEGIESTLQAWSLLPSRAEIEAFEAAGEPTDLGGAD